MVAKWGEKVVGFMIYELHKTKLRILNLAVHPEHRRIGVGIQLAEHLVRKLSSHRRTRLVVEVRETNLDAQLFFREAEFRATSVSRQFYADSDEDAFVMEYRLGIPAEEIENPANRIRRWVGWVTIPRITIPKVTAGLFYYGFTDIINRESKFKIPDSKFKILSFLLCDKLFQDSINTLL